jgi:uracil-DNA glycosylase
MTRASGGGASRKGAAAAARSDPEEWRRAARDGFASLAAIRAAAAGCRACDLWKGATQTVFGEGPARARIVLIGEQPGDREDRQGRPFVGPAGLLLDAALERAGLPRPKVYVTNVVKHFKWKPSGKRRLHEKPNAREVRACRPWVDAEIARLSPLGIGVLGATAAKALLGAEFRVSEQRGVAVASPLAPVVIATVHPASLLRLPDPQMREREIERFVADLRALRELADAR